MTQHVITDDLRLGISETRREYFENHLVPHAVVWNEDTTKFAEDLVIQGGTFSVPMPFEADSVRPEDVYLFAKKAIVSPCAKFMFISRTLVRGESVRLLQGRHRGEVRFTTNVMIPVLLEIVGEFLSPTLWMSLTPHEIISMRKGIQLATGKVVVGGLGLGWLLQKIAAKPSVTEIVLVEQNESLVGWMLPRVRAMWPHINAKLKDVVIGDAIEAIGRHGPGTRYAIDIWEKYGAARDDKSFQAVKEKFNHIWGWGDVDIGPKP